MIPGRSDSTYLAGSERSVGSGRTFVFRYMVAVVAMTGLVPASAADAPPADAVRNAMRRAAAYYREHVASHGGYVYHYTLDLKTRWGEGLATPDQIWVQPPGTPTVGLAFLAAFEATGDRYYLDGTREAAEALVYGQMRSGGWTNCIDFDPRGSRVSLYRNGKGRGRNTSSLDDGQTQSALLLLIRVDSALSFEHAAIHDAAQIALDALLDRQFPNGAFPQVWDDEVNPDPPAIKASFPDYDWRTEGRIKEYWDMYTLNDNVAGYVVETLIAAHEVYREERYLVAVRKLGDFLILAQMPEPQPGWAQQYNYDMKPIWARKFEPPGVSGDETQEAIETLLRVFELTGDRMYLEPIPRALKWLDQSRLPDGRLARYYELKSNRPLYMVRRGKTYSLTYDDSRLPAHYGWKTDSRIAELRRVFNDLAAQNGAQREPQTGSEDVRAIVESLDDRGRWISRFKGERLVGQPKFAIGDRYLSSETFSRNLRALSHYLQTNTD